MLLSLLSFQHEDLKTTWTINVELLFFFTPDWPLLSGINGIGYSKILHIKTYWNLTGLDVVV